MAKQQGIKYQGILAMPGSQLHNHLLSGDSEKAAAVHKESSVVYKKLTGSEPGKDWAIGEGKLLKTSSTGELAE